MTVTIVLASNNKKKAREMRTLLPATIEVATAEQVAVSLPEETGSTFEENALLKARSVARQSGLIAVADDSGLVVDALGGKPGVRSARFAGDHGRAESDSENNALLLEMTADVPSENRTARFVSAIAIVSPDAREWVFRGTVEGRIGFEPRGANGFGYDPLFFPEDQNRTMAELTDREKNAISHRGRAFEQAAPVIARLAEERATNLQQHRHSSNSGAN